MSRPQRLREVFKRSAVPVSSPQRSALGPATSFHETAALPKLDGKGGCQGKTAPNPTTTLSVDGGPIPRQRSYPSQQPSPICHPDRSEAKGRDLRCAIRVPHIYRLNDFPFVIPTRIPVTRKRTAEGASTLSRGTRRGGQNGANPQLQDSDGHHFKGIFATK